MKILGINGSPNKNGTTAFIIKQIGAECERLGASFEYVDIEDYHIELLRNIPKSKKEENFSLDDDYSQLKAKMLDSDGVIIGSPYYSGKPVLQLKNFIERLSRSVFYRREFKGRHFVGVSTSAVDNCKSVAQYCASLGASNLLSGIELSGLVYEPMIVDQGIRELTEDAELENVIKESAKKLIENIKNEKLSTANRVYLSFIPRCFGYLIAKYIFLLRRWRDVLEDKFLEKGWIKKVKE